MSSVSQVPEPWASAMIKAGLTDPRYVSQEIPSRSRLAEKADTKTSTISAMIAGTRSTDPRIVQRVAEALQLGHKADEVARWVGDARTAVKPFQAHRDADLLTSEEQEAVNELIRLLALPKKRRGSEGNGNVRPLPTSPKPGTGPAEEPVNESIKQARAARTTRSGKRSEAQQKLDAMNAAGEEPQD